MASTKWLNEPTEWPGCCDLTCARCRLASKRKTILPRIKQRIARHMPVQHWIHISLGWGLTLLAVAGFSGLIKTDNSS